MVLLGGEVDHVAVVRPRTELHRTELVVERKPTNVNGTRRDEQHRRQGLQTLQRRLVITKDDFGRPRTTSRQHLINYHDLSVSSTVVDDPKLSLNSTDDM